MNPGKYKLTISLPCYGRFEETKQMVANIVNQTLSEWEAFVVGDGCFEFQKLIDSGFMAIMAQRAEEHGNTIYYWNEPFNHGYWGTDIQNMIIEKAVGKYFIFVANDDFIKVNHFENYYNSIKNTDYDFVFFDSLMKDRIRKTKPKPGHLAHCELIIRTQFLKKMPLHRPVYGHDDLLVIDMLNAGALYKKAEEHSPITYYIQSTPSKEQIRQYMKTGKHIKPKLRYRLENIIRSFLKCKMPLYLRPK